MSSIVKMGSALYMKVGSSLEREDLDELLNLKEAFMKSGDESFVFDLSSLECASDRCCTVLASMQEEARRKGVVYVLTPETHMREKLLEHHTIKISEVYENRSLIGIAMKEKSKGHIPVT